MAVDRPPNRAHGAIDALPEEVRLQIVDWYLGTGQERLTYQQIAENLTEAGHEISKSQVHRWVARQRNDLDRLERARSQAQALAKYLVPDGTAVESAAISLTGALCLEALSTADLQSVHSIEDLAKVAHALGRIQSSAVARDKWEHEKRKRIDEAVKALKGDVQKLLEGMPELTGQILNVIDRAQREMIEKTA